MRAFRCSSFLLCLALLAIHPSYAQDISPNDAEFFENRIRPVLVTQCYECHHSGDPQGELTVDHRNGLLKGGEQGPAIKPADLNSLLLQAIRHDQPELRMPVGKPKLSPQVIADFETWIGKGAPDPRINPPKPEDLTPEKLRDEIFSLRKQWWSFQPIKTTIEPQLSESIRQKFPQWNHSHIDRHVLAKLSEHELEPASVAAPATLIRRLSFALTGLPPTPADVARFSQQPDRDTYAGLVDQYLNSIAYAERWSRHWMDWIRFAESHGSEGDPAIPFAYQYRDYLIRAIAADVPISQVIREHFAGDLLTDPRINPELGINESAIGPAHLRMVFHGFTPTDALEEKVRFIDDQINTTTKAFLGLTVSCARCHDHKFDAITQADYYALFGVFASCHPGTRDVNIQALQQDARQELVALKKEIRQQTSQLWLQQTESMKRRLLDADPSIKSRIQKADKPESAFHLWHLASKSSDDVLPDDCTKQIEAYRKQRDIHQTWRSTHPSLLDTTASSTNSVSRFDQWFRYGNGSAAEISPAGSFAVALDGNRIIEDIYPRGIYSHLISSRDANVLISPRVQLSGKYQARFLVSGINNAIARYVVRDYPREGTVYHVGKITKPDWLWQSFNLDYWDGEQVHFEIHTAADGAVLNNGNPRSWFGIRDVRLSDTTELGPPAFESESNSALLESINSLSPHDKSELARCYQETTADAIRAWQSDRMSDTQALWLSQLIREGWLDNEWEANQSVSSIVRAYRDKENQLPNPTRVPTVWESSGYDHPLFLRGEHQKPQQAVPRRFLSAFNGKPFASELSGRRELAEAILDQNNPLTSRVIVNRIWQHLFGLGLVRTPDNFGATGFEPTHPELLDSLARQFLDQGWSLKTLVREIVMSQTWQQATTPSAAAQKIDPENKFWSHAHLHRLDAEAIRDALLTLSGTLAHEPFGPSVDGNQARRSVYVRVQRNALDPLLRTFDFPEPAATTGRRDETNVPAQALTMLNDKRVIKEAGRWAETILQTPTSNEHRLNQMFLSAFARKPTSDEMKSFDAYLQSVTTDLRQQDLDISQLTKRLDSEQQTLSQLFHRVRERLVEQQPNIKLPIPPQPFARFEFDDLHDPQSNLRGELKGGAKLEDGFLVLDGKDDFFATPPITHEFKEKTLEAWVQPENLQQQGSGVVTHQTLNGAKFDSIVLGEQRARTWLAGSDHFNRTQPFSNAALETETIRPVHVAIVYHRDGRIEGYREGKPYGAGYKANGVFQPKPGEAIFTVGVRHLPASGNRMLKGKVDRVLIYDQALSEKQIADSFAAYSRTISDQDILAAMTQSESDQIAAIESSLAELKQQLAEYGPQDTRSLELRTWTEVARAILSLKEFLFVR